MSHQFSSLHDQSLSLCIEDFISIALVDSAGLPLAGDVLTRLLRLLSGKMVDGDGEVLGEAQISRILEHTYTVDTDPSQRCDLQQMDDGVVGEAEVEPLPQVDLVDEALVSKLVPPRPHSLGQLEVEQVEALLLV